MLKRIVCMLLVLVMAVGAVPMQAFAQEDAANAFVEAVETEPVILETEPAEVETEPVVEETEAVVEETEAVVEETEPAVEETEAVVEETEAVVEETEPAVEETEAVVEETEPVVEETEVAVEETEPALEDGVIVSLDPSAAEEDADTIADSSDFTAVSLTDEEYQKLVAKVTGPAPVDYGDDKYTEPENNGGSRSDSLSSAYILKDDYTVNGKMLNKSGSTYYQDYDYYRITLTSKRYIQLICRSPVGTYLTVTLLDANGYKLTSSTPKQDGNYWNDTISAYLSAGTYYVRITDSQKNNYSYTLYYNTTPIAPTITKAANVVSGTRVYWGSTGAARYTVYSRESTSNTIYKLGTTTATNYLDTYAESGKTYYYYVASNDNNTSYVSPLSYAMPYTYIGTPDFTLRVNRAYGIGLSWNRIEGATGYAVYRKPYYGDYAWTRVATITSGSTTSWNDTSVKNNNGSVYRYTVRATYTNSSLYGSTLLSGCRSTGRTMVRLTSVSISSLAKNSSTSFTVKWTKNSQATGYEVRVMVGDAIIKTQPIGNPNTLSATFSNADRYTTYKIQVRSYKNVSGVGSFYSAWSTPVYIDM